MGESILIFFEKTFKNHLSSYKRTTLNTTIALENAYKIEIEKCTTPNRVIS